MPVLTREMHEKLYSQFQDRTVALRELLKSRELRSKSEGASRGRWSHPESLCATIGDAVDISLAIEDFKAILNELKKLK